MKHFFLKAPLEKETKIKEKITSSPQQKKKISVCRMKNSAGKKKEEDEQEANWMSRKAL